MDLNKAVALFAELKRKIKDERGYLSGNEYRTRVVLIDPVLRMLGWDAEDPTSVRLEWETARSNNKKADYGLLFNDKEVAIVEAKRLGETQLRNVGNIKQADDYARFAEAGFFVLTNGRNWLVCKSELKSPENMKPIVEFNLESDDEFLCALRALSLWRPNLASRNGPVEASEPILSPYASEREAAGIGTPTIEVGPGPQSDAEGESFATQNQPNAEGWTPLPDFVPDGQTSAPSTIRFPDHSLVETKYWKDILVGTSRWLCERKLVNGPLRLSPHATGFHLNTKPEHEPGRRFIRYEELPNGFFVFTNLSGKDCVNMAISALQQCGSDPANVHVKFD